MTRLRFRLGSVFLLALSVVLGPGCGALTGTGTIKGKITVNSQPLPSGLITFESDSGNHDAYSAAIKDGEYETTSIPTGLCKVSVIHSMSRGNPGGNDLAPPKVAGPKEILVPAKYHASATSGLTFTVKSGSNKYDQDLTP